MAYIKSNKNQNWLLPLNIKDMIPLDHVCFLVEDFVSGLDFRGFDVCFGGVGAPAYHPRILVKILIQGMLGRERSSRRLAKAVYENFVFMYLSERCKPDFRTISRFRKDNAEFLKVVFKETVGFAVEKDLVDLSCIAIDGSMFKASASKKRSVKREHLDILDKAIDKMIAEDIELDELEDEIYGDKDNGGLTGMDRRDMKRLVREFRDKQKAKEKIKKAKESAEKNNLKKVSLTDPDCRFMQNKKRFTEPSYNTQISVSRNQIILANDVCQAGHDVKQFIPSIEDVKKNVDLPKDTKVTLDCGYSDGDNIKYAEDNNIDLYVPSRAMAQELDGKEQSLNHDMYDYDWEKDEIIENGFRFRNRGYYTRKDRRKIRTFYCPELKKKKDVPYYFKERL
ncbi:MAG: transposase [bacterium]